MPGTNATHPDGQTAAPAPSRGRARSAWGAAARWLARFFFGEDFFVTYARADAATYAAALANRLLDAGYTCFVDQWHPVVDADIPPSIRRELLRASTQVIVVTPAAAASAAVAQEVLLFAATRRPIVPIEIGQALTAAPWAHLATGVARSVESAGALAAGTPSPHVLRRLVETFRYRRRAWRIRLSFGLFAATSVALGAWSLWQADQAEQQRRSAAAAAAEAALQRDAARSAASAAEAERASRTQAVGLLRIEERRAAEAASEAARQASAAQARGRLADSRALAITSRTLPLAVDQRLLLAAQAWRLDPNGDARNALASAVQEAGSLQRTLYSPQPERTREVIGAGLSADGRLALAGYADGSLAAWTLDGSAPHLRPGPRGDAGRPATRAALAADGHWAAIGHVDGGVELVALGQGRFGATRTPLARADPLPRLPTPVTDLTFSADGRQLAVGWSDGRVRIVDVAGGGAGPLIGDPFDALRDHHRLGVLALAFSPDGRVLASSHGGGRVRLWTTGAAPRAAAPALALDADVSGLVFDAGGTQLLLALGAEGRLRRVAWSGGDATPLPWPAAAQPTGSWTRLARAAGGREVVVQPLAGALQALPLQGPAPPAAAGVGTGSAGSAGVAGARRPDGVAVVAAAEQAPLVAVGLPDGTLQLHRMGGGAVQRLVPPAVGPRRLAFDRSGQRLYAVGSSVAVLRLGDGAAFVRVDGSEAAPGVQPLAVDAADAGIALVLSDGRRRTCDERRCGPLAAPQPAPDDPAMLWQDSESGGAWRMQAAGRTRICSSLRCEDAGGSGAGSDGRRWALSPGAGVWASAADRTVQLCRHGRCRPVPGLEAGSDGWISALAFTPDGAELVVATSEGQVRFIAAHDGRETTPARTADAGAITRIAFDRAAGLMATGGRAGIVQLWDLASRRPLGAPSARPGREQVMDLALAPGGARLAALYSDGSVELRTLDPAALLLQACAMASRTLAIAEWRLLGGSDDSCPAVCAPAGARCLSHDVRATVHR